MLARRFTLATLALLCALVGALLFGSAPSLAGRGHVFGGSFGGKGAGEGQFEEPSGVAVGEASGDVYVVDSGNNRVEYFSSTGTYLGQFDGSGLLVGEGRAAGSGGLAGEVPTGRLSSPNGIAVDNSCQLHKPVLTEATVPTCASFDPSNGDVYVADIGNKVVDKFSPTGEYVGQVTGTPGDPVVEGELFGIGVGIDGKVWVHKHRPADFHGGGDVAQFGNGLVNEFVADEEIEGNLPIASGLAADSLNDFYILNHNGKGTYVGRFARIDTIAGLRAEEEEQSSGVAVELSSDEVYVDDVTAIARFGPKPSFGDSPSERFGAGHLVGGGGLAVSSTLQTVYVADSAADVITVFAPEGPSKPVVESQSVSDVASESATFLSELNPHGARTEYRFEYGRCGSPNRCAGGPYETSVPVPEASAGSSFVVQDVKVHAQLPRAAASYHFRIVAHNEFGTVDGEDKTFTTQPVGGTGPVLADGRQWELVSPANKHGALIAPLIGGFSEGLSQAAEDGGGIAYRADSPVGSDPPANGRTLAGSSQVLSVRGAQGWSTRDIATPHNSEIGSTLPEYRSFSSDLSSAFVSPEGIDATLLSPEATEQTPYLRREALCDSPVAAGECYRPLLTGKEGLADVPAGTKFGEDHESIFAGASPDLSHVILRPGPISIALTATPVLPPTSELYEWSAGVPASEALRLVSVLPASEGGGLAVGDTSAEDPFVGTRHSYAQGVRHSVSNDGSRIFWGLAHNGYRGSIYMRDTVHGRSVVDGETIPGETVRVDVRPGMAGGPGLAMFQVASTDGSKVFFSDEEQLTGNSGAGVDKPDLYECDIVEEAGKLACRLTDLTPASATGSAEVRDLVSGVSEDGSYVYFVANGVLGENENSKGEVATQGGCSPGEDPNSTCNLYEFHNGAVTFIAALSVRDEGAWAGEDQTYGTLNNMTAYTSPNGRYLTFVSERSLTGYDNRDAVSGKPDAEVYLYDAATGRLACVSCNPTGGRPAGVEAVEFTPTALSSVSTAEPHSENVASVAVVGGFRDSWIAANLPPAPNNAKGEGSYQTRPLSDSGRVFFNSNDALVPQDVNGNEDLYEFEPMGMGSCTASSVAFAPESGGCVSLISSGTSPEESGFLEASRSGGDVFFLTYSRLAGGDSDSSRDVYDAHVCAASTPCAPTSVSVPPCASGDACKGAPAPQPSVFGDPASATFAGAGNVAGTPSGSGVAGKPLTRAQKLARALRACGKKPKRKRSACKRQARKRYGAASAHGAVRATSKGQG